MSCPIGFGDCPDCEHFDRSDRTCGYQSLTCITCGKTNLEPEQMGNKDQCKECSVAAFKQRMKDKPERLHRARITKRLGNKMKIHQYEQY